jgi:predicted nuclease with TOPRIM domain
MEKDVKDKFETLNKRIKELEDSKDKLPEELEKLQAESIKLRSEAIDLNNKHLLDIDRIALSKQNLDNIGLLNNMLVLKDVMCASISKPYSDSSIPIFEKEELYPYKAKMLELIKKLT